ncbi:MAG: hypothetical protein EBZ77_13020, partial [Chitinophagia bacterium]|nr:hypothetical protein [Chitinophagia bacterium]
ALRRAFRSYAAATVRNGYRAIISFCPFSFATGNAIKGSLPHIYYAMEIADFRWSDVRRSPLTALANRTALRTLHKATLIATPSFQRSAWLAGRAHLNFVPATMLNTAYLQPLPTPMHNRAALGKLLPDWVYDKKMVLYTGAVNDRLCVKELVEAYIALADRQTVLIATGFKDNEYCNAIRTLALKSPMSEHIFLLPYVSREEMLALQGTAQVGACLMKEIPGFINSQMLAPNKTGEYLSRGLYVLGVSNFYMDMFAAAGVGSLAATATVPDIAAALRHAVQQAGEPGCRERIAQYVQKYFCMQQQLKPIIALLQRYS